MYIYCIITSEGILDSENLAGRKRSTVWILGDQLLLRHPGLKDPTASSSGEKPVVLMIESWQLLESRSWHPRKLILVLSAMRHYAEYLQREGYPVHYLQAESFQEGILKHIKTYQPTALICMASSNYHLRRFQQIHLPVVLEIPVQVLPNSQFLVERYDPYPEISPDKNIRQETFYRRLRRHYSVLLDADGNPLGGQWNYDAQNRKPLPADAAIPEILAFPPDEITRQVIQEVEKSSGTQSSKGFNLAVDHQGADLALHDFLNNRLAGFGTYEDAMTSRSSSIYHSLLSPYLNLGLLDPLDLIRVAEQAYQEGSAPLNAVEGFIRQILGWREYIYWQYWRLFPALFSSNHLEAHRTLPAFFWTGKDSPKVSFPCTDQCAQIRLQSPY